MKKVITFLSIILIILFGITFIIYKNKQNKLDNNLQNSNDITKNYEKIAWLWDFRDIPKFPASPTGYDNKEIYYVYYYKNISYDTINNYFNTLKEDNYNIENISQKIENSNNILKYEMLKENKKIQIIWNKNSKDLELLLYYYT